MIPSLQGIHWRPAIGDPTIMGWVTVAAYFLTAAASFFRAVDQRDGRNGKFWMALGLFLLILGVNKQFDLQSLCTDIGRVIARRQGWYGDRRAFQFIFVMILFVATMSIVFTTFVMLRASLRQLALPCAGVALLLGFIVIRAASFHHVDRVIRMELSGVRINWILELGGIGIILASALSGFFRRALTYLSRS